LQSTLCRDSHNSDRLTEKLSRMPGNAQLNGSCMYATSGTSKSRAKELRQVSRSERGEYHA
jgi:hypothetical protein